MQRTLCQAAQCHGACLRPNDGQEPAAKQKAIIMLIMPVGEAVAEFLNPNPWLVVRTPSASLSCHPGPPLFPCIPHPCPSLAWAIRNLPQRVLLHRKWTYMSTASMARTSLLSSADALISAAVCKSRSKTNGVPNCATANIRLHSSLGDWRAITPRLGQRGGQKHECTACMP